MMTWQLCTESVEVRVVDQCEVDVLLESIVGRVRSRNSVTWNSTEFRRIPVPGIPGNETFVDTGIPDSEFRECLFWQELGTDQISFM